MTQPTPATGSPILVKGRPARWHDAPAMLRDKALQHGGKIFTVIDGQPLSYTAFDAQADAVADNLCAMGVKPGDRIASLMFNCVEQVLGWFGANRAGAIWAPLNASLFGDDLVHTLADTGARVLIVDAENADKLAALPPQQRDALRIYVAGGTPGQEQLPFEQLLAPAERAQRPVIAPGMPAMILYSGGSTGLPKGIVLPHFALVCVGYRYGEVLGVSAQDRHFTTLPMFHASGTQFGILGPLLNDMTSAIDRRFSVSSYWERVRSTGATIIDPIGTMMTVLTQAPPDARDRDHAVRVSTGVNGQVPPAVPAAFTERFGVDIVDIYGNSESGGAMLTSNQVDAQVAGSVGHPNGWSQIAILDDNDCEVPAGTMGRIAMRPTIPYSFMLGYHNNAARTVEAWRNFWLQTGDLGRVDEKGYLFFAGREAHWLRRRGENISANEVESILSQHPAVQECIVVGVPSELGEEDVKACIVARGAPPPPEALVRWCEERMAAFKVPRYIAFVDDFPRSAAKREVERNKVRAWSNDGAWDREREMGRLSGQGRRKA